MGAFAKTKTGSGGDAAAALSDSEKEGQSGGAEDPLMELFQLDADDDNIVVEEKNKRHSSTDSPKLEEDRKELLARDKLGNLNLSDDTDDGSKEDLAAAVRKSQQQEGAFAGGATIKGRLPAEVEFEFLDFKTPFSAAAKTTNQPSDQNSDLGVFFKDVQNAPGLLLAPSSSGGGDPPPAASPLGPLAPSAAGVMMEKSGLEEQLIQLGTQLNAFETNLVEYDEMLKTLDTSESESDAV